MKLDGITSNREDEQPAAYPRGHALKFRHCFTMLQAIGQNAEA